MAKFAKKDKARYRAVCVECHNKRRRKVDRLSAVDAILETPAHIVVDVDCKSTGFADNFLALLRASGCLEDQFIVESEPLEEFFGRDHEFKRLLS